MSEASAYSHSTISVPDDNVAAFECLATELGRERSETPDPTSHKGAQQDARFVICTVVIERQ
jgi:hypothetical protein